MEVMDGSSTITVAALRATHTLNPLYMGCHSDSGFGHQVRSFYSNLLSGESFEPEPGVTWGQTLLPTTADGDVTLEGRGAGMHGQTALRIQYRSGLGLVGLGNRGYRNEGLFLRGGHVYEGYLFVKSKASTTVEVSLRAYGAANASRALATATLPFGGGNWTRLNFSLTPTEDARCEGIAPRSDPSIKCSLGKSVGHVCVRCGAEFVVGMRAPGDVSIDFVFLQPGEWGRFASLPVHRHTVETLQQMGVSAIRFGGSFVSYFGGYYFWKNWRGVPWARPSVGAHWEGDVLSSWGPFEQIDMCIAAGIEPIISTTSQDQVPRHTGPYDCCTAEEMAELIEYCYGNASTPFGRLRIADGHPEPYRVRFLELGNEQYNTIFPQQVAAMEARARALGVGGTMYYISPSNGDYFTRNVSEGNAAEALHLADHLLEDFHVTGGVSTGARWSKTSHTGGAVDGARQLFANQTSWTEGAVNLETNAGIHTMERALMEGADLNDFFSQAIRSTSGEPSGRIKARTASFCTERSGYDEGGANDQGLAFYLPNMSWLQPPGHLHAMVHHTWLPAALPVRTNGSAANLSVSAQLAVDRSRLRLIVVNNRSTAAATSVAINGWHAARTANVTTLAAPSLDAANPPGQPDLVSPTSTTRPWRDDGACTFPPLSITIIVLNATVEPRALAAVLVDGEGNAVGKRGAPAAWTTQLEA